MKASKAVFLKTYGRRKRKLSAWLSLENRREAFDSTVSTDGDVSVFEPSRPVKIRWVSSLRENFPFRCTILSLQCYFRYIIMSVLFKQRLLMFIFFFLKLLMCSCVSKPNPVHERGRRVFPVTEWCIVQEERPHSVWMRRTSTRTICRHPLRLVVFSLLSRAKQPGLFKNEKREADILDAVIVFMCIFTIITRRKYFS